MGLRACSVTLFVSYLKVSIYPKAEMGLRDRDLPVKDALNKCFNLPEGRDGFKRVVRGAESAAATEVSIYPKAEMGLRAKNKF